MTARAVTWPFLRTANGELNWGTLKISIHVLAVRSNGRGLTEVRMSKSQAAVPAMLVFLALALGLLMAVLCGRGSQAPADPDVNPFASFVETPAPAEPTTTTAHLAPTPTLAPLPAGPASDALREGRFTDAAQRYAAEASEAAAPGAKSEALLGQGIARHEAGDREGAITSLRNAMVAADPGSAEARRAAYLLGLRLADAGRGPEATEVLQPWFLAPKPDALQPYIDSALARSAALAGQFSLSEQAFARALASPEISVTLRADAYRGLSAAARERNDGDRLTAALAKLVQIAPDPGSRYELATWSSRLGNQAAAVEQFKLIVQESPESRFAMQALEDLKNAQVAIDPGQEGLVYYRRGMYAQAKALLLTARDDPAATPAERAFRAFYYAASLEDSGDARGAIVAYDHVETYGSTRYVHRARYWAARVSEGLGQASDASLRYVTLATDGPPGEFSLESRFRAGYTLFRSGDSHAAVTAWDSLGASRDQRLLYWKGRAQQHGEEGSSAAVSFTQAMTLDPHSFFGQAAAEQLNLATPLAGTYVPLALPLAPPNWAEFETWLRKRGAPARTDSPPAAARELMLVGLREQATAEITEFARSGDPWRLYVAMRAAHELGLLNVSAQIAVNLRTTLAVDYEEAPRALAQVAYPLDFAALLNAETKLRNVDPLYLAALIRQESFWDPSALSHADAYGLTQVIPETGRSIADALGVAPFETRDLLRPAVAIKFGAYYIGQQLKQYGRPYVALAAYNAGPAAAQRWLARAPKATAADFVESVDYAETQLYVQLVMQSYSHYAYAWRAP
jgi:soluble lytic murein transglycosylase